MEPDKARALALISVAVENAPPPERLWIEDIYQNIYCGAGEGIRRQATGIVAEWGNRYGRKPENRDRTGLAQLTADPVRMCEDGEPVSPIPSSGDKGSLDAPPVAAGTMQRLPDGRGFSYGSAAGPSLRDIDTELPPGAERR
jgi:hypothetical protein